jgi:predicted MFS family arabinose efflux permease
LLASGYTALFVGIVITVTIFASVIFNVIVTLFVGRVGEKRFLIALAFVMALSGLIFAWNPDVFTFNSTVHLGSLVLDIGKVSPVILLAALLGAISVTGTETGPFQSMEQAMLACSTDDSRRTLKFSYYNFFGYLALSAGSLFPGAVDWLTGSNFDLRLLFFVYSGFAIAMALVYYIMPEIRTVQKDDRKFSVSPETKSTVLKLSLLFSMDSFGGGFVLQSILTMWFSKNWGLDIKSLSLLFAVSGVITAFSIFMAERVARKIGLLNTMVFTHLPSSIFLILIPFAPTVLLAVALLFARQSISQMDVPTRQSYVMAIVKPEDRTAVASLTNIPRTCAQGISPIFASYMIIGALPFVLGGGMKIAFDVSIYFTFNKVKPPEEEKKPPG